MQHRTLLNVWLILLVNYGHTDDICGTGKRRRGDKCCLSQSCKDTGFAACIVNNTKDTCTPCSEGFYLIGQYETSNFPDPNVCAEIKCFSEEVKNADGECVCDGSRGYYRIDEGKCGLELISCAPAGRQLSQNGLCDPCPEGYFKPKPGNLRCRKKSNITCLSTEFILEGNTTTDRKCVKNDVIVSTSTYSPPLSTSINITNDVIDRNGNDALLERVIIAVVVFAIVLSFVVAIILLVRRHRRLRRRQQLQDLENLEHDEHLPLQPVNGFLSVVDDDNIDIGHIYAQVPYQIPQGNITHVSGGPRVIDEHIDDESHGCGAEVVTRDNSQTYVKVSYACQGSSINNDDDNIDNSHTCVNVPCQFPQDNIPNVTGIRLAIAHRYQSPEDNIPNEDDIYHDCMAGPCESPGDNIENDEDNIDIGHIYAQVPYQIPQGNITNVTGIRLAIAHHYQSPQDNIPSEDDIYHDCMAVPCESPGDNIENDDDNIDNSLTYAKVPYQSPQCNITNAIGIPLVIAPRFQSPQDNIPNAVIGDMPSNEGNSNKDDGSFNPMSGDDRLCQGAVGGDTDDNGTASSINNENHDNRPHYQPSSEHNPQHDKMLCGGPRSFDLPVQNSDANLPHPPPHFH